MKKWLRSFFIPPSFLSKEELSRISAAISELEKSTSGEIRVSVRQKRRWRERAIPLFDIGVKEFFRLSMEKTKDRSGVLLFILVSDKQFTIIADEGINEKVDGEYWNTLAVRMSDSFKSGKFCDGVVEILREIGSVLSKEFPIQSGDKNELSNDVVINTYGAA